MSDERPHVMRLIKTNADGTDVWDCPVCGRRFVMQWMPCKRILLYAGDSTAAHSGSKGGLKMGSVSVTNPQTDRLERLLDDVNLGDEA